MYLFKLAIFLQLLDRAQRAKGRSKTADLQHESLGELLELLSVCLGSHDSRHLVVCRLNALDLHGQIIP